MGGLEDRVSADPCSAAPPAITQCDWACAGHARYNPAALDTNHSATAGMEHLKVGGGLLLQGLEGEGLKIDSDTSGNR